MSDAKKQEQPYHHLGLKLKRLREKCKESVAEVSGAVEIEAGALEHYENGATRPSEDILQLLISHFDMDDKEADMLWSLAGYDQRDKTITQVEETIPSVVVMPMDVRIAYTDMAHVSVNNYGVILDFLQSSGPDRQPMIVSRLGMSREHALSIIEILQKALAPREIKALPAPVIHKSKKRQSKKKTDE